MAGAACVELLQWALPRLRLRWSGFARVRRQVCRRIDGRIKALGLSGVAAYRHFLERHPEEWHVLDTFCLISISRLARDREVFERLGTTVLPELAAAAIRRGATTVRAWSAGCASGEEPVTLALYWHLRVRPLFPHVTFRVVATDLDRGLLTRAEAATYPPSSMRELPADLRNSGFRQDGPRFILRDEFRHEVEFLRQDLREEVPAGPFDLILCRNVGFTYFDRALEREVLERMLRVLHPGGALVIGLKEQLPDDGHGAEPWVPALGIYRKGQASHAVLHAGASL